MEDRLGFIARQRRRKAHGRLARAIRSGRALAFEVSCPFPGAILWSCDPRVLDAWGQEECAKIAFALLLAKELSPSWAEGRVTVAFGRYWWGIVSVRLL